MSKVGNLESIIEAFGPHLHDAPYDGWRTDRVIDKVVPTHCPYCAVQCGMNLLVENNHVVGFEPRYDFPVNEGRLCPKGVTAYLQIHHPDRLLHPLIKRNGIFERATWDEALDLVVSKFKELQTKHGKDSIGVYSGSSLTTEKTYLMGKFARAGLAHATSITTAGSAWCQQRRQTIKHLAPIALRTPGTTCHSRKPY